MMKVAILAERETQAEILSRKTAPGVEWHWAGSPEELLKVPDAEACFDLCFAPDKDRLSLLKNLQPRPVVIGSVCDTLASIGLPFIRINDWPGFLSAPLAELALMQGEPEPGVRQLFDRLGWPFRLAPDITGMVSPRIIASIINEAYFTMEAGTATREDIDLAMKGGTNYPLGPFEWAAKIGLVRVGRLLLALSRENPGYEISNLLRRESGLGVAER